MILFPFDLNQKVNNKFCNISLLLANTIASYQIAPIFTNSLFNYSIILSRTRNASS